MWIQLLSMKLTAASSFYDFNSETDAVDSMQVLRNFNSLYNEDEQKNLLVVIGKDIRCHGSSMF